MSKKIYLAVILITICAFLLGIINSPNQYKNRINNAGSLTSNLSSKCNHCNVMLIDADILRADALPCYGYMRNTAPNICTLATKSVIFSNNYSPASWTLPSVFSTITSLYPNFHHVQTSFIDKLSPDIPTLQQTLHDAGYTTVYIGATHAAVLNNENGGLRGYDKVTNEPVEKVISELSIDQKPWFIHYYRGDLHMPYLISQFQKPIENLPKPEKLPITFEEFDQKLNIYLKAHYADVFKPAAIKRYGLIISSPYKKGDTDVSKLFYKLAFTAESKKYIKDFWKPRFNTYMNSFDNNNPADVAYVRMMYDTNIKLLDADFGNLLDLLNSEPISKKTITIFMSDHGEAFGENNLFSHDDDYHSQLYHTPLIMRIPGVTGKKVEQSTGNIDIFPTILDLLGMQIPTTLQGMSLSNNIFNKTTNTDRFILSHSGVGVILQNSNWLYFLPREISDASKAILHDKSKDPLEGSNIISNNPDLGKFLYIQASTYRSYQDIYNKKPIDYQQLGLDPKKIERLKKEGYF